MLLPIFLLSLLFPSLSFQKFVIIGTVRDTTGRSVANVRVLAIDENFQPIRTIFVDGSGQFFIRGLSPGRYQFRVETTGTPYQEYETGWIELQAVRVRPGGSETHQLDIVLKFRPNKSAEPRGEIVFAQNVPENARALYEQGAKNFREGHSEAAVTALKQALDIFPDYFQALELLGKEQVKAGLYQDALPVLLRAVKVNPRAAGSYYALGVAYLKLDKLEEAIDSLKKAAGLNPTNANTQMMLGIAFRQHKQLAESEAAFKKAWQVGGAAAAEAHFYLAGIYEKQLRFAAAAAELELYLKESKDIPDPNRIREMISSLKEKEKSAAK
ncbi:MAG TPA: tetratricopeptide repeat protein [Blastocatellia bacterium]|nr:tetratricopeptide repeat protein [Blastocatellia bacterium]HMV85183.1 tetratricopeptide repeat protein [Blastocatellia bacterium]HMX24804.1 tetratricopeptide repeat protein [Blastocatellia bacterium]HMY75396.1 tetratricopeptide repeat protein [Blastocatellia bacterium]HMZ18450.1 tetratricopeptide repeat protein [Blastocatellia bacterium]